MKMGLEFMTEEHCVYIIYSAEETSEPRGTSDSWWTLHKEDIHSKSLTHTLMPNVLRLQALIA